MRLILLIAWLFAEAWSIGKASDALGGVVVFALLVLIAAAGIRLIQHQGFRTLANMQQSMQRNELPAAAMLDGVIVFLAGILLIVPGFISDGIALLLLFSGIRRNLARRSEAFLAKQNPEFQGAVVIEGEYHSVSQHETLQGPRSATKPARPGAASESPLVGWKRPRGSRNLPARR